MSYKVGIVALFVVAIAFIDLPEQEAADANCESTVAQTIPKLVGLSSSEAESAINKICPKPEVISFKEYDYFQGVTIEGRVVAQYPPAGSSTQNIGCLLIEGSNSEDSLKRAAELGYLRTEEGIDVPLCDNDVAELSDVIFADDILIDGSKVASEISDFPSSWEFKYYESDWNSMVLRMESDVINYSSPSYFCLVIDVDQGGFFTHDVGLDVWHGCSQKLVATGERVGSVFIWMKNHCDFILETCRDFFQRLVDGIWDIKINMYRADFEWAGDWIKSWHDRPCSETWDKPKFGYCSFP
jgi:hypothetical protein